MSEPARHLRPVEAVDDVVFIVVHPETGERVGLLTDHTQVLEDEVAGLQRDVRGWAARYGDLKRDKEAEAKESPVWPVAVRVFDYWRQQCRHLRSEFTLVRFEMIRPHLERLAAPKKGRSQDAAERLAHAEAVCKLAVDGIAHDPYISKRKNGTSRRHDGWHLIFDDGDRFEERCNSAPMERIREVMGQPKAEQQSLDQAQDAG